jgi:hypothetical protein
MRRRHALLVVGLVLLIAAPMAHAQDAPPADWELLDGSPGSVALWAQPDGAIFAADAQHSLYRSADEGTTWTTIPSPPGGWSVAPDPVDPAIVYGIAPSGLFKSSDSGGSWRLIRPSPQPARLDFDRRHLAISPADHNLLYLVEPLDMGRVSRIVRSRDGGTSWEQASQINQSGSPCETSVTVLMPHPTYPARIFSDLGCYAGRNFGTGLAVSRDRATTWQQTFRDGQSLLPQFLVGGGGADPRRLYLTTLPFSGGGGARVYRSDDAGATWVEVLDVGDPYNTALGGLAYDPAQPDHVFAATGHTPDPSTTGVQVSADGGQTWAFLGRQDIGWVNALVRLPDGVLVGATNEGIWRLP